MLKWQEENNRHLGFDDDTLIYIVDYDPEEGWRWLNVFEGFGIFDYIDAEEAKAGAENDYAEYPPNLTEDNEPYLTPEEIYEILGDRLYEERRDARLCE